MLNITNEDNMDLMARYPDRYFDLAIVDPPYGFRTEKTGILNFRKSANDKEWNIAPNAEYFKELKRVSINQIVWGGGIISLSFGIMDVEDLFIGIKEIRFRIFPMEN